MHRFAALILALAPIVSAAAEELHFVTPATTWQDAIPTANASMGMLAFNGTTSDRFSLFPIASGAAGVADGEIPAVFPAKPVLAFAKSSGTGARYGWLLPVPKTPVADIRLDWLDAEQTAKEFGRVVDPREAVITTTFERGTTGLNQKVFCSEADDLVVLHLRADKPGGLSFRLRFENPGGPEAAVEVQERRMLIFKKKLSEAADSPLFEMRAWVYPMESEVTPGEKEISVRGEGEALVIIATAQGAEGSPALAQLPDRLKQFGFGGDDHPDISKLWDDLLERHLKARRALPVETK